MSYILIYNNNNTYNKLPGDATNSLRHNFWTCLLVRLKVHVDKEDNTCALVESQQTFPLLIYPADMIIIIRQFSHHSSRNVDIRFRGKPLQEIKPKRCNALHK